MYSHNFKIGIEVTFESDIKKWAGLADSVDLALSPEMGEILKHLAVLDYTNAKANKFPREDGSVASRGAFWLAKSIAQAANPNVCYKFLGIP